LIPLAGTVASVVIPSFFPAITIRRYVVCTRFVPYQDIMELKPPHGLVAIKHVVVGINLE
jgi:hypothetical protein